MGDVTFLSPKRYQNSKLSQAGVAVNELKDGFVPDEKRPVYATIQGFKGLDAKVVILCDVDALRPGEVFAVYVYCGDEGADTALHCRFAGFLEGT